MSSCLVARTSSPGSDEIECMDMVHPLASDNNLPLISTTLGMPATIKTTDRPVVLCMAPVHRLSHEDSMNSESAESPEAPIVEKLQKTKFN